MSRVAALAGCVWLAACGREAAPLGDAPGDTLRGVIASRIGRTDGAEEYLFSYVSGLVADSLMRVFVADARLGEVRAFSADGEFLFRVARKGAGPGEVSAPCCLGFDRSGRLWVRDGGNARYSAYRLQSAGAVYEREVRMQHGDPNRAVALTFDTAGRLVDVGLLPGGPKAVGTGRFHVTLDGAVEGVDTVPDPSPDSVDLKKVQRKTDRGFAILYLYRPFGSVALAAHGPRGTWATAVSGHYLIRWTLPNGRVRTVSRPLQGPVLSDEDIASAQKNLADNAEWAGLTVASLPFGVPERKAPLFDLWFDRAGRLWVQRTAAPGEPARADIYTPDGAWVAVAEWPRAVKFGSLADVDSAVAVGTTRDSLDVPTVVVVRWRH